MWALSIEREKYKKRRSEILKEVKRVEENTILEEVQGPFLPLRDTDRHTGRRIKEAGTGNEGVHSLCPQFGEIRERGDKVTC